MSYKNILEGKNDNFLLVIDELNRGNAASIFGSVFQLLDRDDEGWSSYSINISDLELKVILEEIGFSTKIDSGQLLIQDQESGSLMTVAELFKPSNRSILAKCLKIPVKRKGEKTNFDRIAKHLTQNSIELPSNLSIVATINTSDESIYYLDSAFKRRWDWEHVEAPYGEFDEEDDSISDSITKTFINTGEYDISLGELIVFINNFMRENSANIRGIEDKQIGWWFIKLRPTDGEEREGKFYHSLDSIEDKLMFYLWDNVFARNKQPLRDLLGLRQEDLVTYSDFVKQSKTFINKIINRYQ